eukprot:3735640-Rhodomonas_salina.1
MSTQLLPLIALDPRLVGAASIPPPEPTHVKLLCSLLQASSQLEQGANTASTYGAVAAQGPPAAKQATAWSAPVKPVITKAGGKVNKVFPRRKAGQDSRSNSQPVVLSETVLRELFYLPLQEACAKLGICATALKKACRKLGIKKWPYRTSRGTPSPPNVEVVATTGDVMLFKETAEWFRESTVASKPAPSVEDSESSSSDNSVSRLLN